MGTVQEHLALCCVTDWACEFSKEAGPLRYLDTHAMAPLNLPIGDDFSLVSSLGDRLRDGVPAQAKYGTCSYFGGVREAALLLRDRGITAWYPTHFLQAWVAARARNVGFDALLFENDGEGMDAVHPYQTFCRWRAFCSPTEPTASRRRSRLTQATSGLQTVGRLPRRDRVARWL